MCDLSYKSSGAGICGSAASPRIQNAQSNLVEKKGLSAILHSSVQESDDFQKSNVLPARCSRALTY